MIAPRLSLLLGASAMSLAATACVSLVRNDVELHDVETDDAAVVADYQLIGDQFSDLVSAWSKLISFRPELERMGYTIAPGCFHHSRYLVPEGVVLTFVARNPGPQECSPYGAFRLWKREASDWQCTMQVSASSSQPCGLAELELKADHE